MNNGKKWVVGLLGLGALAGLFPVLYWRRPENSVRWSFTQIHTSLVRGKKDAAIRFLAPRILWNGREWSAAEFLDNYGLPPEPDVIETRLCPVAPEHWTVMMKSNVYCFVGEKTLWRLHAVGTGACTCR